MPPPSFNRRQVVLGSTALAFPLVPVGQRMRQLAVAADIAVSADLTVANGWRAVLAADPIAAVLAGHADAAFGGHAHWVDSPEILGIFGGLPGGLVQSERDDLLADTAGRSLWDAVHRQVGLQAVPIASAHRTFSMLSDRPLSTVDAIKEAHIGAPPAGRGVWQALGATPVAHWPYAGAAATHRYRLEAAGPVTALVVRDGRMPSPADLAQISRYEDPGSPPLSDLPLDIRVAVGNATADWVRNLHQCQCRVSRDAAAALRRLL